MKLKSQLDHRLACKPDMVHQAQSVTTTVNEWKHSLSASWKGGWANFTSKVVYHNHSAARVITEKRHFHSPSYTKNNRKEGAKHWVLKWHLSYSQWHTANYFKLYNSRNSLETKITATIANIKFNMKFHKY